MHNCQISGMELCENPSNYQCVVAARATRTFLAESPPGIVLRGVEKPSGLVSMSTHTRPVSRMSP